MNPSLLVDVQQQEVFNSREQWQKQEMWKGKQLFWEQHWKQVTQGGLSRWLSGKESACQCRRCKRCGFDPWVGKIRWRRKRQPSPVFLPGESHGQGSLVSYSPWGHSSRTWLSNYHPLTLTTMNIFHTSNNSENCWPLSLQILTLPCSFFALLWL